MTHQTHGGLVGIPYNPMESSYFSIEKSQTLPIASEFVQVIEVPKEVRPEGDDGHVDKGSKLAPIKTMLDDQDS